MIYQVFILKSNTIVHDFIFKEILSKHEFNKIFSLSEERDLSTTITGFRYKNYDKYRISYNSDKDLDLLIVMITGLNDQLEEIKEQLNRLKNEFVMLIGEDIDKDTPLDPLIFGLLNPIIESILRSLKPKVCLIGYPGVGKTTITNLIKEESIPIKHIPSLSGEVSTIKIGKLYFDLWDFAGQETFSYSWNIFLKGSDAVLLITDSTLENVELSKFFVELIRYEAPNANAVVIGNKQDLSGVLPMEEIEKILDLKAYSMVAIDPNNRNKMIQIISYLMGIDSEYSPSIKPLLEKDKLIEEANMALNQQDFMRAVKLLVKASEVCESLGEVRLSQECAEKAQALITQIKETVQIQESEQPSFTLYPPLTELPENLIPLADTNFWINPVGNYQFELGCSGSIKPSQIYKIDLYEFEFILSRLNEFDKIETNQDFIYNLHPNIEKLPLYISYYKQNYYFGLFTENEWIGVQMINLNTIKKIKNQIEKILTEF